MQAFIADILGRSYAHLMIDTIWHLRGSIALVSRSEVALDQIEQLLTQQQKPITDRGPDYITFDAPLWRNFFGPNWLAMVIYDRGRFWVNQDLGGQQLCYELRSLHGMLFCLLGAAVFFVFGFADRGLLGGAAFAAFAFGWLYGMNLLLALVRVPRAIRRALRA